MKKNLLFLAILILIASVNSSDALDSLSPSNDRTNNFFYFGFGPNKYTMNEKGGENKSKISPTFNLGYRFYLSKNLFFDTNINFDLAKLSSKSKFSEFEFCDWEDVFEGKCGTTGSYIAVAEGQDIDSYRLFDFNLGYNFWNNFSIFAGINVYKIKYYYKNHSVEGKNDVLIIDHVDEGDESALGFGLGAIYEIPDTNFYTKLLYTQASYDGGNLYDGGKQKIEDKRISITLNYKFK